MYHVIQFVGPNHAVQIFSVKFLGFNAENGRKLLFTLALIVALILISKALRFVAVGVNKRSERIAFWVRQGIHVFTTLLMVIGICSIWFDNPERLTTAIGLVSAGLAFALQRVVTSAAGYLLILRGRTFNVGDRIVMGGVRGDVIGLGFLQTTIMEMGQPPAVQSADPAQWVHARQYTGRIVSISNATIFDEPVYNYTREFPYIWEEMLIPISYKDDWQAVEKILLEVTEKHTIRIAELGEPAIQEMERRYVMVRSEMKPRVYLRMTDNWIELAVRFLASDHGVRELKDAMSREILGALNKLNIGIASSTYDIVGLPPVRVEMPSSPPRAAPAVNGQ